MSAQPRPLVWLGRFVYRWRWMVIAAWAVVLAVGVVVGGGLFDRLSTVEALGPDAESAVAQRLIDDLDPSGEPVYAVIRGRDPYDPALVASVSEVATELRSVPGVVEVNDLYTGRGGLIGADNTSTVLTVQISDAVTPADQAALEDRIVASLRRIDAPEVLIGGPSLAERAFADQAVRDAAVGEAVAIGLVALALGLFLGGAVAAGVPLVVGLVTVATTFAGLFGLSTVTDVSEYAVNVVTLLGLGLAIDYSLLLIYRYREQRSTAPVEVALAAAVSTAGRAVLVSGVVVGAAFASLSMFAEPLLAAMAAGGAIVAAIATVCALTLVPAVVAVAAPWIPADPSDGRIARLKGRLKGRLGRQIARSPASAGRPRRSREGLLAMLAALAQRRAGPVALASSAGLLLLALPLLGANLANSDVRALPPSVEARQAHELLERDFPAAAAVPVTVLVRAGADSEAMLAYLNVLNQHAGVTKLELRTDIPPGATVIDLYPHGDADGPEARALVEDVRAVPAPAQALVAGPAAELTDYRRSLAARIPAVIIGLLATSTVLLLLLTGSVVIPLKALVLNGLTLAATLGVLVLVFQHGWGAPLLGFESWGAIDLTTPVLLFVFIFGLTMDYEVFLLARITERWRATGDNDRAVIEGIRGSGRVVTAAAACMVIVFLGFVVGDLVAVKEIGVGMVVAIILDVTVIRGLLLPAFMTLLGEWNWWSPRWVRAALGRLAGPGTPADEATAATGGTAGSATRVARV